MAVETFQPIYEGRDFYVPAFDVKIKGVDLPTWARKDFIEVRYTDKIGEFDSFDITINNWDTKEQDFKYTGSRKGVEGKDANNRSQLFDPGKKIELWMGYFKPVVKEEQPLRLMLVGIINQLTPAFPSGGLPTLKISGKNVLQLLQTTQETRNYRAEIKDSDIALKISNEGNLKLDNLTIPIKIDEQAKSKEEPNAQSVLQYNQYDIVFLLQLARKKGYDLFLKYEDERKELNPYLYFGPSTKEPRVSYLLEWGKSLIQFQPTLTIANQVNELTVRGWNPQRKEKIEVTVNRSDLSTRSLRDIQKLRQIEESFKQKKEIIVDRPIYTKEEAKTYALGQLEQLAKDMVTTRGSTIGIPDLRAGSVIQVEGLGNTFSGRYFVTSTTHTIGASGYTTEFEARLEEKT